MSLSQKAQDHLIAGIASRKAGKEINYALAAAQIIHVPLASLLDADGDPLVKFAAGAFTVPGFSVTDTEALCLRWNNHATPDPVIGQVTLPPGLDSTYEIDIEFFVSKTGATLADATTITVQAWLVAAGGLHDSDSDAGGVTNALTGDAAAKTTAVLTRTITSIPTDARSMTFTFQPTDDLLDTDDLCVHDVRVVINKVA
jgi:hypothetical protein